MPGKPTGTLELDQPAPSHGDNITFTVTTENVEERVYVTLNAFQNGEWVMTHSFEPPGPSALSSVTWTEGAAECKADLHFTKFPGGHKVTLDEIDFAVAA